MIVLLSGGLDSSTLLASMSTHTSVRALSFYYGAQHNSREIRAAGLIASYYNVRHDVITLPNIEGSALTGHSEIPRAHYSDKSQKATVVPNRNMALLAHAAAFAIARGESSLAYACHAGDAHVYPDCRPAFVAAMREALSLCDYRPIALRAPFISWTKRAIAEQAEALGVPIELTYSCYIGEEEHCGECGACRAREEAFQ